MFSNTYSEFDIYSYSGRSKPSIGSGSATFGHPRPAHLRIRSSLDEGGADFAKRALDCHIPICIPASGESDIQSFWRKTLHLGHKDSHFPTSVLL